MNDPKQSKAQSSAQQFGARLRSWRRTNNIKQAALAEQLGVSQPAIVRWERGLDAPNPGHSRKLQSLMAGSMRDALTLEMLFLRKQSGMRALFDCDGMQLIAMSEGFREVWPDFSSLVGTHMADNLINEAQRLLGSSEIDQHIREGAVGYASGVSLRHTDIDVDTAIPHRWHICFRNYSGLRLADVVYEPCAPDSEVGITDLVYLDTLASEL